MDRCRLIINFLIFVFCVSVYADNDWNKFPARNIYKKALKKECVFPFTYQGRTYNDCTNDGDNGLLPWCSLSKEYKGKFKYCYDFLNIDPKCLDTYTINGKQFKGCDYFSKTATYKQCQTNSDDLKQAYCVQEHIKPSGKPLLHFDDCDSKYTKISKFHTMCIGPSDFAIPVPLSQDDKTAILSKHNSYRNEVNAKYMFKLYWDDELARFAQAHSDMCAFDHDLAENRISPVYGWFNGQNMVKASDPRTPLASLLEAMFSSEKPNFRYNDTCLGDDGSCLHYTQMMLATMTRVGCGHTHCLYPDRIERFLVCNYIHSQFDDTSKAPFIKVDSVAGNICPPSKRDGNLCDCGNKICDFDTQQLYPLTCNCINNQQKRSINKRDTNDPPIRPAPKPFAFISDSEPDSDVLDKRDLSAVERHDLVKRNLLSKFRKID